jgi:1,4-alpha-glucan branching enzyme
MYAFSENFVLPLSHDEVVHGKGSLWGRMPGDAWNKAANLRALLAYMWAHPGKQLLFQGGEIGQEREWSESRSIDWHLLEDPLHGGLKTLVADLNRTYRATPALWTKDFTPEGFSWIDANDASGNVLSFLRHGVDADGRPTVLACVANFSGSPKRDYRVGLPFAGRWREVLNTDAQIYGGSGVGNLGAVEAERTMWHGRPASAVLQLPPAGVLWLVPEPGAGAVRRRAAATAPAATGAPIAAAAPATEPATEPAPAGPGADEPGIADEVPASDASERAPAPRSTPSESTGSPDLEAEVPASDAAERPSTVAGPAAVSTGTSAPVTRPATEPAGDSTASRNGLPPAGAGSWDPAPGSAEPLTGPSPADADTGELPTVSAPGDTGGDDAVPDSPSPSADTVLDDGPAAPVAADAPEEAPPTPGQSGDTRSSAAERTDDDSSTAQ